MCTVGVSLYRSIASHPLSLFTRLYDRPGPRHHSVSVNLVEEQPDRRGHRTGAGSVRHVETVSGTGQFDVADGCARLRAQLGDEVACLLHGDDGVSAAVDDEERWRVGVRTGDR